MNTIVTISMDVVIPNENNCKFHYMKWIILSILHVIECNKMVRRLLYEEPYFIVMMIKDPLFKRWGTTCTIIGDDSAFYRLDWSNKCSQFTRIALGKLDMYARHLHNVGMHHECNNDNRDRTNVRDNDDDDQDHGDKEI